MSVTSDPSPGRSRGVGSLLMAEDARSAEDALAAAQAAEGAIHLQQALASVASVVRERFQLWAAGVGAFRSPTEIEVLATWSIRETFFKPGTRIGTGFTDTTESRAMEILEGKPFVMHTGEADIGLVEHMLAQEGFASIGCAPLEANGVIFGFIAFASAIPEAIDEDDLPFLLGLGRGLSLELAPFVRQLIDEQDER